MPKMIEQLIKEGYTKKQAQAIVSESEKKAKKKGNATDKIKKAADEKNKALNSIYNW